MSTSKEFNVVKNNYSLKQLVRDVEVNIYHSLLKSRWIIVLLFTKAVDTQHQIVPFLLRNGELEKLVREIQNNAGKSIADTILSLSHSVRKSPSIGLV